MKKIITIIAIAFSPALYAQDGMPFSGERLIDGETRNMIGSVLALYLLSAFILSLTRSIQSYRLKAKMIDKGVSDKVIEQFLQPANTDSKSQAMKFFLILLGIAVGLTAISLSLPVGIHSAAIMAFSVAASFLGYFYYLKQTTK